MLQSSRDFNFDDGLWPLIEGVLDGVILAAPNPWRVVYANSAASRWLGSTSKNLLGRAIDDMIDADSKNALRERIERIWGGDSVHESPVFTIRTESGSLQPLAVLLCRVVVNEEPLLGLIFRQSETRGTAERTSSERRDPLTGLPDREFLLSRLTELLGDGRSADRQFAVLFVDLDNFKEVNDRFGHLVGDRVLHEAARRLAGCVRDGDRLVRYGGDEFVMLVERVTRPDEVEPIVRRIETAIAQPIVLPEGEVTLSLSVGAAMASSEHRTPEELLAAADRAMYASKRAGS